MLLVKAWMRQLAGASGAALIVPVALLGAVIALAFAGGLGRIGSLGQAFWGPRLPISTSPASPKGGRTASMPRRSRRRAASSSPVLLAGVAVGAAVSSSGSAAPVGGHPTIGVRAPHSRSIGVGGPFVVEHAKQQVGARVHHTVPRVHQTVPRVHQTVPRVHQTVPRVHHTVPGPGSIRPRAGHARQEVGAIRRGDGHSHKEVGAIVHRTVPVTPRQSRGTAAPAGDPGHAHGINSSHESPGAREPASHTGHAHGVHSPHGSRGRHWR